MLFSCALGSRCLKRASARFPWQLIPTAGASSCGWGCSKSTRRKTRAPCSFAALGAACSRGAGRTSNGDTVQGQRSLRRGWGNPCLRGVEGGPEHPSPPRL